MKEKKNDGSSMKITRNKTEYIILSISIPFAAILVELHKSWSHSIFSVSFLFASLPLVVFGRRRPFYSMCSSFSYPSTA